MQCGFLRFSLTINKGSQPGYCKTESKLIEKNDLKKHVDNVGFSKYQLSITKCETRSLSLDILHMCTKFYVTDSNYQNSSASKDRLAFQVPANL